MKKISKYYRNYKSRRNKLIFKVLAKVTAVIGSIIVISSLAYHGIKNLIILNSKNDEVQEEQVEQEIVEEQEIIENTIENSLEQSVEQLQDNTPKFAEIPKKVVEEEPNDYIDTELLDSNYEFQDVDFESLITKNDDVVGWINIDDTVVDYPILQDEDNEYYSHHDIEGNKVKAGSIFLDANNELLSNPIEELDDLSFIYGHHMKGNSMFATICKYKNQSFVDENPFFVIYTPDGYAYKCDVFAGMLYDGLDTRIYNNYNFASQDDFQAYMDYLKENSMISTDVEVSYDDKLVALVTCSYENGINGNLRYVVFAKMSKQYIEAPENYDEKKLMK